MKKRDVIALLRRDGVLEMLSDGPVALAASDGGRIRCLVAARVENSVKVTMGKYLRRTWRIPVSEIKSP